MPGTLPNKRVVMAALAAGLLGCLRSQPELLSLGTRVRLVQGIPALVAPDAAGGAPRGRWDQAGCAFGDAFSPILESVEAVVVSTTMEVCCGRDIGLMFGEGVTSLRA